MITRRRRETFDRHAALKTGIFFLGAGVWLAGVIADDARVTGAALVILAIGIAVRISTRARWPRDDGDDVADDPGDPRTNASADEPETR